VEHGWDDIDRYKTEVIGEKSVVATLLTNFTWPGMEPGERPSD
jgi:hypothetical protein